MNFQTLFGAPTFQYFILVLINRCNLHCEQCITMCNRPLNPNSPHEILREYYEIPVSDVERFCQLFEGHGEGNYVRITGGEPTFLAEDKFTEIIEVLKKHGRRIWMITNGYGMLNLPDRVLKSIDRYTLDDHGINHEHMLKVAKRLKKLDVTNIRHLETRIHYDCITACDNPKNRGKCKAIMQSPTIYKGTVYPCCRIPFIEIFRKEEETTRQLRKAGWTLDNGNLVETMKNWRNTIPKNPWTLCQEHCWKPHFTKYNPTPITLKPHDVIAR